MNRVWQQINNLILIVQEVPAQFMQRFVAKLIWYLLLVVFKRNLPNVGDFKSEFDTSFEADTAQNRTPI